MGQGVLRPIAWALAASCGRETEWTGTGSLLLPGSSKTAHQGTVLLTSDSKCGAGAGAGVDPVTHTLPSAVDKQFWAWPHTQVRKGTFGLHFSYDSELEVTLLGLNALGRPSWAHLQAGWGPLLATGPSCPHWFFLPHDVAGLGHSANA